MRKIRRYTDLLLDRQEYTQIERLLNTPNIGGNSAIASHMAWQITHRDDIEGKAVPTPLKLKWADQLRAISGKHHIEDYGDRVVKETRTDRPLDDYVKYLDMYNDDVKDWQSQILVVGGGDSPLASQLTERGITVPIINIDPSFPDRKPLNESKKYPWNFLDSKTTALLRQQKFDEAWALYSLPMYALSANDITQFYHQALTGLKPNGILRVFPYNHFSRPDFDDGATILSRRNIHDKAEQIVEVMKTRPDLFDVSVYSKKVKNFFHRSGFPVSGVKIRVLTQPEQIDSFFKHLNSN